jgi:methyl acetate hydrolase
MAQMSEVDAALRAAVEAQQIPGVVAMAATDREIIYQGAFGKRALDSDAPMTPDSVFWIASMTKAITAAACMQLVEQRRLALEDPLEKLLPDFAAPQVLEGFDADGKPRLRTAGRAITLRHLMTHTAGYCYNIWNPLMGRYAAHAGLPAARTGENKALAAPLVFDPGGRWEYGINIDLVGKAVEAASGKRLDAYLQDHVFAPLGMRDTGFRLAPAQRARRVGMHQRGADGSLNSVPFELPEEPEFHPGGGGLFGTAPDYIRFVRMLLNGGTLDGNRVLKAETVRLMGENHIGDLNVGKMTTAIPEASNDFDPWPDQDKKWGLSFLINTRRTPEGRSPGSLAWAGLANTYFWVDPARDVGGVIMMQLLPFVDAKARELFAALERGVYASLDGTKAAA